MKLYLMLMILKLAKFIMLISKTLLIQFLQKYLIIIKYLILL